MWRDGVEEYDVPDLILKSDEFWPLVRFAVRGGNTVELLCVPVPFEVDNAEGITEATRRQVRLPVQPKRFLTELNTTL